MQPEGVYAGHRGAEIATPTGQKPYEREKAKGIRRIRRATAHSSTTAIPAAARRDPPVEILPRATR